MTFSAADVVVVVVALYRAVHVAAHYVKLPILHHLQSTCNWLDALHGIVLC